MRLAIAARLHLDWRMLTFIESAGLSVPGKIWTCSQFIDQRRRATQLCAKMAMLLPAVAQTYFTLRNASRNF